LRILLADDHTLFLEGVSAVLTSDPELEVSTALSQEDAMARMQADAEYDLVILDYQMPGMNGLSGLARMVDARKGAPVALMSGTVRRHVIDKALELGAVGFLPKTMSAASMIRAVKFMAAGERFVPLEILQDAGEGPAGTTLSLRETQVLRALAEGQSNKEIATALNIQEATVKVHVKTVFRKLGAKNRTHAALLAYELMIF
jgi:two-component system nitrate/nitrite response regulator NarL